ncbi:MAG TPA: NAD(P)/FAD-dependent oxidoreductase [Jiangellales bacterium]|nr:NAD(P)/FAD-dependent oxidoreductase [Jiangellales bacterium]
MTSTAGHRPPHVLIVGGGYVGMYTALRLRKRLQLGEARVTVVDPRSYMTYQPFLPEAAAGSLEPRHVVVPLRRVLRYVDVVTGRITSIRHREKVACITPNVGEPYELMYDYVVIALGSVARTLPIPGLAEQGIGFKQVEEAINLRNHVLDRLDVAESTDDPAVRSRALTFVFVGGGYAGVEALGELEDMARYATRYYEDIRPKDLRFMLVEATGRILPEVGPEMGRYTVEQLRDRNIDIRLGTRLESCVDGHVVLSDGEELDSDTIVWTAGVKANPVLTRTDLPLDERGRLNCLPDMRVATLDGQVVEGAFGAGDCAAVPDLTSEVEGATTSPSAQHAVRQAKLLADNIVTVLRGHQPEPYKHKHAGSVASLGLYKGVAQVYGIKLKGFPAWFMHRTYHMSRMPTFNRKVRVVVDWTLALLFKREVVSLGRLHAPREEFLRAAEPAPPQAQRPVP